MYHTMLHFIHYVTRIILTYLSWNNLFQFSHLTASQLLLDTETSAAKDRQVHSVPCARDRVQEEIAVHHQMLKVKYTIVL